MHLDMFDWSEMGKYFNKYSVENTVKISTEAAGDILVRNEADVYRVKDGKLEKLAPIEAAKPLSFAENKSLVVKKDDISALEKWAKREVNNMFRKKEQELKKSRQEEL